MRFIVSAFIAISFSLSAFGKDCETGLVSHLSGLELPVIEMNSTYKGEERWTRGFSRVKRFKPSEKESFRVFIKDGLIRTADGQLFSTRPTEGEFFDPTPYLVNFVVDSTGAMYAFSSKGTQFYTVRHSSLSVEVVFAGEIAVDLGRVEALTNLSGHYLPSEEALHTLVLELREQGLDIPDRAVFLYRPFAN